ncbi:hypothetical protein, partial [Thermodesulfatator atlanticus]
SQELSKMEVKKLIVCAHREAIGRLGGFAEKRACWLAAYKERLPEPAYLVKPEFYLFLQFDDARSERDALNFGLTVFDELMAELAAETLLEALNKGCTEFIFSCDAGVSRSAGMAKAFERFLAHHKIPYHVEVARPTMPNPLVENRLWQALKTLYSKKQTSIFSA